MAEHVPWFLFVNGRDDMSGLPGTNAALIEELRHAGSLRSPECIAAFQAVDRRHFWPAELGDMAYADMPLRSGKLHLSAPHIYAKALEALRPLQRGMSFLNVGSGTGYFNTIVSELLGDQAANHGVEIHAETVAHAQRCCQSIGKNGIEFTTGNAYQLNVNQTMRYDRIYLGACANSRSKYLYSLLEVGGILIGPFQYGHTQELRRVVRQTETQFNTEVLGSVQFATLLEPTASLPPPVTSQITPASPMSMASSPPSLSGTLPDRSAEERSATVGLPGVPFVFSLLERPWTPDRSWLYPSSFRRVAKMGLLCRPLDHNSTCLPTEIWVNHILVWCPRSWFEAPRPRTPFVTPKIAPLADFDLVPSLELPRAASRACCENEGEEEAEQSDDGASTRAPSSAASSEQTTPETRPSQPPTDMDMDLVSGRPPPTPEPEDLGDTLFEVFDNGRWHAIGTTGDPDDVDPQERHRYFVPPHALQMAVSQARTQSNEPVSRRRTRTWLEMNPELEDDDDSSEEDEDEEMVDAYLDDDIAAMMVEADEEVDTEEL